jgi:hypothetical protein
MLVGGDDQPRREAACSTVSAEAFVLSASEDGDADKPGAKGFPSRRSCSPQSRVCTGRKGEKVVTIGGGRSSQFVKESAVKVVRCGAGQSWLQKGGCEYVRR